MACIGIHSGRRETVMLVKFIRFALVWPLRSHLLNVARTLPNM